MGWNWLIDRNSTAGRAGGCRTDWTPCCPQGLLVFPLFVLFRLLDILGQNDLLGNLIKLSPENPRSIEN